MKRILIIIFLAFFCTITFGKYVQTCDVKYKTKYGWSKKYTVEVIFMTGSELNTATRTFNYSYYSVYAVIFWARDEATVIKLKTYLLCSSTVTKSCIKGVFGDLKGFDQDGDEWNICKDRICF